MEETEIKGALKNAETDVLLSDQTEMITRWLPDGTLTYVNDVFCRYFNKSTEELIGHKFIPDIPGNELDYFYNTVLTGITPSDPSVTFEHSIVNTLGETRWLRWTDRAILDMDNKIISYQSVGHDVTEQKKAEELLRRSEERYKRLVEDIHAITWEYDIDKAMHVYVSPQAEEILGYPLSDWQHPDFWQNHLHPEDRKWASLYSREHMTKGMSHEFEYRMIARDGSTKWFREITSMSFTREGSVRVHGILIDITEKAKTEQILRDTQLRLASLLNNLSNVVFYETGGGKEFITQNILGLIGYSSEEITRDRNFFVTLIHPDDREKLNSAYEGWVKNNKAGILSIEFRVKKKDGVYIWLEDHVFEMVPNAGCRYIAGVMIDVTERKKAENLIKESLKEKELLIKEIHHRVKNNLQIVSSLLKLQSGYLKDSYALNMLQESQNRIQSMALVHQKLYQSKDLSRIDFNDYLKQLLSHLMHAYKINADNISLNIHAENINIGVDTAIPCGLIINELVSNSLKHAFPDSRKGKIDILLQTEDKENFLLTVKDDGIGFPKNIDYRNTTSLGLQLVQTLTEQLNGETELIGDAGTEFRIKFQGAGYNLRT